MRPFQPFPAPSHPTLQSLRRAVMLRSLLSALGLAIATLSPVGAQQVPTTGFQADLDSLVARVIRIHPRPWAHTSREGFRSEEHTSELQSRRELVCRLLLEKKKY